MAIANGSVEVIQSDRRYMFKLASFAKALLAAAIAALGALAASLVDNNSLADVSDGQWAAIALAFLVALGAVYKVPNSSP